MLSAKPLGPKSSLLSHSFPSFYACYLLKSIKTVQSTTVYIGSTPSPPRRIRQHNGEIAQGARKTRSKRPWVMQMIVHGFPSRLAALQFEWAWQHPHKSRHLRNENGSIFGTRASKLLKKNIGIVRTMISKHPFNTWPLHVKLFTEEAVQCWKAFTNVDPPLPPGFTCSVELEGVDGKSGHPGSGRQGPIDVDDTDFTYALLAKNHALLASGCRIVCSVCHQSIENYSSDHLATALCPSPSCEAVSHLTCLSQDFLTDSSGIIPRGGHCRSCHNYVLWGDVVRGCYRRLSSAENDEYPDVATDDMFLSDEDNEGLEICPPVKRKSKVRARSISPSKPRLNSQRKGDDRDIASQSSEGELFDFANIASSSDSEATPIKRKPGRPRKNALSPQIVSPPSEGEILPRLLDVANRKHKKKNAAETRGFITRDPVNVINISSGSEDGAILSTDMFRTPSKGKGKEKQMPSTSSDDEFYDLDKLSSRSDGKDMGFTKWRPSTNQKLKAPLNPLQVRPKIRQRSPNTVNPSSIGTSVGHIGSSKGPGPLRKLDMMSSNTPPSSNEGNSSVKRRPGQPRQLDTQKSTSVESVKRRPGRPRKLDSSPAVIHPLSPKPSTLLEGQASSSPESDNQATLKRRPGRPRKDPSYHAPTSPNRQASESKTNKSDHHSHKCPKFREHDLIDLAKHAMSNLTLTAPKVT